MKTPVYFYFSSMSSIYSNAVAHLLLDSMHQLIKKATVTAVVGWHCRPALWPLGPGAESQIYSGMNGIIVVV